MLTFITLLLLAWVSIVQRYWMDRQIEAIEWLLDVIPAYQRV